MWKEPSAERLAIDAVSLAVFSDKLRIVSVNVAGFALLGSAFEARFVTGGGFVAIATGYGTMRAE